MTQVPNVLFRYQELSVQGRKFINRGIYELRGPKFFAKFAPGNSPQEFLLMRFLRPGDVFGLTTTKDGKPTNFVGQNDVLEHDQALKDSTRWTEVYRLVSRGDVQFRDPMP